MSGTPSRPRVLEIGMFCLFKQAWPDSTEFLYAGPGRSPLPDGVPRRFHPGRWIRPGTVDLVVAHTAIEEPWRPSVLARLLSPVRLPDASAALAWEVMRQLPPGLSRVPLAVLDMHDERAISARDLALLGRCVRYFKRELPPNPMSSFHPALRGPWLAGQLGKLRPISLGLPAPIVAAAPDALPNKTVDLFFAGSLAHAPAIRAAGFAELAQLAGTGVRLDIAREHLPRAEFLARCARARLVWSPEGLGWDCFRHYEAALCGAVPLINLPTIRRHAPLLEGVHALYYEVEGDGLSRALRAALADPRRLDAIGREARLHVLRHHTHAALCDYIVRECLEPDRVSEVASGLS